MKLLKWLGTSASQTQEEANRLQRYEYGVREVQRWTQARKAIAQQGEETTRRFQQEMAEHARKWGPEGEGMKFIRWNMESWQEETERHLQEADQRLAIYRNIVLMQGRI
jgi:hypothetical protein